VTPQLTRIRIYPIKALDPLEVSEAAVRGGAGLAHDREFRLVDEAGQVVNGKSAGELILQIRSSFSLGFGELTLSDEQSSMSARLSRAWGDAESWLSERLGKKIRLEQNADGGFPDDEEAAGPTLVSRATLVEIASWFGMEEEEARRRFRANLEIDGVPAFWEDRLFGKQGETVRFQIGSLMLEGVKPCQRCVVPSRDSKTGELPDPSFSKKLAEKRKTALPSWAEASRFDHFYRVALNTVVPAAENGKTVRLGDEVVV